MASRAANHTLLLCIISMTCVFYIFFQKEYIGDISLELLRASATGVAASPYRYRVLTPAVMFAVDSQWTYMVREMCVISLMQILSYLCAGRYRVNGIVVAAMLALVNMLAWNAMIYSTSRYLETIFIILALWMLRDVKRWSISSLTLYGLLVILATFNRTTGYLLVVLWLAYGLKEHAFNRRMLVATFSYGLLWIIAAGGLLLILGTAPPWETIESIAEYNSSRMGLIVLYNLPFLVLGFASLFTRWRLIVILTLLLYFPPVILLGRLTEVGLWLPVMPILLIAILSQPINQPRHLSMQ